MLKLLTWTVSGCGVCGGGGGVFQVCREQLRLLLLLLLLSGMLSTPTLLSEDEHRTAIIIGVTSYGALRHAPWILRIHLHRFGNVCLHISAVDSGRQVVNTTHFTSQSQIHGRLTL